MNVETAFHPHHLLYTSFISSLISVLHSLGIEVNSELFVPFVNLVFGAFTLALFYYMLRKTLKFDAVTSFLGVGLLGFSFGFWYYSVCVETLIIPLFFAMLTFLLLLESSNTITRYILIGIASSLAILFHQLYVLFTPVVILGLYLNHRHSRKAFLLSVSTYVTVVVALVGVPYLTIPIVYLKKTSFVEYYYWLTTYAHDGYWQSFSAVSLFNALIGFGRDVSIAKKSGMINVSTHTL